MSCSHCPKHPLSAARSPRGHAPALRDVLELGDTAQSLFRLASFVQSHALTVPSRASLARQLTRELSNSLSSGWRCIGFNTNLQSCAPQMASPSDGPPLVSSPPVNKSPKAWSFHIDGSRDKEPTSNHSLSPLATALPGSGVPVMNSYCLVDVTKPRTLYLALKHFGC